MSMISLTQMLNEDRGKKSLRRGCLMAMLSQEDTATIVEFGKRLIGDRDLYTEGNEFGREHEGHITIRYGFTKDLNELEIRQLLEGHKPFLVEIEGLDIFDASPQYNVSMFKVSSPVLKILNEISGIYPNEQTFPDYNPHITLAYTKKQAPIHRKDGLKMTIPIKEICYSPISGGKSHFILEDTTKKFHYIGDCVTGIEDEQFRDQVASDATEISHLVDDEKGKRTLTEQQFISNCDVPDFVRQKIHQHEFEFAINNSRYTHHDVVWAYDTNDDIHYFFV
jgi:2'-5' RNA ligase superfamily